MNYQSRIYDLLNRERDDMLDRLPQPNMIFRQPAGDIPTLHGGRRPRDHPLPAYFSPDEPATLATGSNVGSMMPASNKFNMRRYAKEDDLADMAGGKINWAKVGRSIKKEARKLPGDLGKEIKKQVIPEITKYGLKAAKDYLLPAAETVAANPELLLMAAGRKSRKPRKMSRAIREYSESDSDSDSDGSIHVDINSHKAGGVKRPRAINKRAEIVKRVMQEKGLKMIEASKYVKAHGLY